MSRRGQARRFVALGHESQRVPLGRTAILAVMFAATVFVLYSMAKDGVRLPFSAPAFVVKVEMTDAVGLAAENEPPVSVAGVTIGRVTAVTYSGETALVTMELDPKAEGRVFRNALVDVRPQNGANVLSVDIRPGDPSAGELTAGSTLPPDRVQTPVQPHDVIGMLDADTRAYLSVIFAETDAALEGRGGDVAKALRELGRTADPAAEISRVLSRRRQLVSELVGDVDTLFRTSARRRDELNRSVEASSRILATIAARERGLAVALQRTPGVLAETEQTIAALNRVVPTATRLIDQALPVARRLQPALRAVRAMVPDASRLLTATTRVTRDGRQPISDLVTLLENLEASKADVDVTFGKAEDIIKGLDKNRLGVARMAEMMSGLGGQQDDRSVVGRTLVLGFENANPVNFGLPNTVDGRRTMRRLLPRALGPVCGERSRECAERILTPKERQP